MEYFLSCCTLQFAPKKQYGILLALYLVTVKKPLRIISQAFTTGPCSNAFTRKLQQTSSETWNTHYLTVKLEYRLPTIFNIVYERCSFFYIFRDMYVFINTLNNIHFVTDLYHVKSHLWRFHTGLKQTRLYSYRR